MAPPLPVAVQEAAAATTGPRLYVIGGYDIGGNSTANVEIFDGRAWTRGPSLPTPLNHPGAAVVGDTVYVAGGFTPNGASNRAFALTAATSRWHEIAPLSRARGALALLAIYGRLYAIGGRNGGTQIAIPERYDPATNTWTDLPAMPDPRNHVAGFVDGRDACVAGGRTPSTSAAIDCFDTTTHAWTRRATLPVATSGANAVIFNGVTVVGGGEPASETSIVGVLQERRGAVWSSEPMLVPRHGTAYAMFDGRLWACGGATAPGFHAVAACTSFGT